MINIIRNGFVSVSGLVFLIASFLVMAEAPGGAETSNCSADCSAPPLPQPVNPDEAIKGVVEAAKRCPEDGATALVSLARSEPGLIAEALEAAKVVLTQEGFSKMADSAEECLSGNPALAAAVREAASDILSSGYYDSLPGGGAGEPIEPIPDPSLSPS